MNKTLKFTDNLNLKNVNEDLTLTIPTQSKGFRTSVTCQYDDGSFAKDEFGEDIFEKDYGSNQTVLGGALFALLKIFGVKHKWSVDTMNKIWGIADDGVVTDAKDNYACLFGAGTGGCGESPSSVKPVNVYEREITSLIPIRVVNTPLPSIDKDKYWFKKELSGGYTAYYLKTFEAKQVKVLWKDAPDGEDGSEVPQDVWNTTRSEPIESFVELTLRIDKKDYKEWFDYQGNTEVPRINSIGLFTGVKGNYNSGQEYRDVQLFSKINFSNEIMQMDKSMTIIYRVYAV